MNFEDILRVADDAVIGLTGRRLDNAQRIVLEGSWKNLSYQEIAASDVGYTEKYLKQDVGPKLWKLLSRALGEPIRKTNFRTALELRASKNHTNGSAPSQSRSPLPPQEPPTVNDDLESIPTDILPTPIECIADWGELDIDVSSFCGRANELEQLEHWILQERQQLLVFWGMGGVGKTTLAVKLAKQIQSHFNYLFCYSLRSAPSPSELLSTLLQFLTQQDQTHLVTLDQQISQLIHLFKQQPCLVVLDATESVLQTGQLAGQYQAGYEGYRKLLQRVGENQHQSCLIWISREKPGEMVGLEGRKTRSLFLSGLSIDEGRSLLEQRGQFIGSEAEWMNLNQRFSGNPFMLNVVAATAEVFGGWISEALKRQFDLSEHVWERLDEQFNGLSEPEKQVMYWLAIAQEPVSFEELQTDMVIPISNAVVESLVRRSLCTVNRETPTSAIQFTLEPAVIEYVTEQFLTQIKQELETETISVFNSHPLLKPQSNEYTRKQQFQRILQPLASSIRAAHRSTEEIAYKMQRLLAKIRSELSGLPGYAGGNLINLAHQLALSLTNCDFSGLTLWQADLQDMNLHNVNVAHSDLSRSVFAAALGSSIILAFEQHGTRLATGDDEGRVLLWQVEHGQLICQSQTQYEASICSLAFSPDGHTLAVGSDDHTISLWDVQSEHQFNRLRGHHASVLSICFSQDGHILASGSSDRTIRLWDVNSGRCLRVLTGHHGDVTALSFSPDRQSLVSCGRDQTVRLWRVSDGECLRSPSSSTSGAFNAVVFCRSNLKTESKECDLAIAAECDDTTIKLWNVDAGDYYRILLGHVETVAAIAFSADGHLVASSSNDRTVKIWNAQTGDCLQTLTRFSSQIQSLAFSPNSQTLITTSDRQIQQWEVNTGRCLRTVRDRRNPVCFFAFSPDNTILVTGNQDHTIRLWKISTGQWLQTLSGHTDWVRSVTFSPNGRLLASGSDDRTIKLWNVETGECLHTLREHSDRIWVTGFSPNGQLLASGSDDQIVKLWNVETGECMRSLQEHTDKICSVCFSPNGRVLATGSYDCNTWLWDITTGTPLALLEGHGGRIHSLSFSPDGSTLATGSYDGSAQLWSVETGRCIHEWQHPKDWINAVMFDAAGRAIAVSSDFNNTNVLKLWNITSGELIQTLTWDRSSQIWLVNPSPNSQLLASGSRDEVIRIWRWETGQCLKSLRVDRPYVGMNIKNAHTLTETQRKTLKELGAIEH